MKISKKVINKPTIVQTLDEVMFIVKKETFNEKPLNADNKTWHLYSVGYCLSMNELGKEVYVIPSGIYHKSSGASMNGTYYKELKRICKIYKVPKINTTMGKWHTNKLLLNIDILKIKLILKAMKIKEKLQN